MTRERPSPTTPPTTRPTRPRSRPAAGEKPEIELSDEEVRALADEGVDPEEVQEASRRERDDQEASDHDRDTARDDIEGLAAEQEEGY